MNAITQDEMPASTMGNRRVLLVDIGIVVLATFLTAWICVRYEVSEALFHWTRSLEGLQFDELPVIFVVMAVGSMWFALRRYREERALLIRQRVIDARLAAVLAENRKLAQQHMNVQEMERKNLARELHDELGQYLNAIKIDAVAIRDHQEPLTADVRNGATSIARNIDHVYAVVTELIRRLRPVALDELGVVAAVEHCVEQWRRLLPNTRIDVSTRGAFSDLGEQASLTLYRLVQESLTNVAKHARATNVTIELNCEENNHVRDVTVKIADDGVGANLQKLAQKLSQKLSDNVSPNLNMGFGLVSMRERVEMQGGMFDVQSTPTTGFTLKARFPAK